MIAHAKQVCSLYNKLGASTQEYKDAFEALALKLGYASGKAMKAVFTKHANSHGLNYTEYLQSPGKWEAEFKNGSKLRAAKQVLLTTIWSTEKCRLNLVRALQA